MCANIDQVRTIELNTRSRDDRTGVEPGLLLKETLSSTLMKLPENGSITDDWNTLKPC